MYVFPQPVDNEQNWINFANTPYGTEIKIFDIHGHLVAVLAENDYNGGVRWDLKNQNGQRVASGVYIFYAKSNSKSKTGKISVVR